MELIIATVDEILFSGEAKSVTVPAQEGEMTILHKHMPLITTLKEGTVVVRAADLPEGNRKFEIKDGVLEVHQGGATIIL